ncbi:MAG: PEP/pyruvate-binding domain-containing protein [Candidatus Buchananbacteria bacterium]
MDFIKKFERLNRNNAAIAGGKGASLGEMTQAGIPVPPGFVILAQAFEEFIKQTHLQVELESILDKVNHQEVGEVEAASEKIQALILLAKMPPSIERLVMQEFKKLNSKYVAVRSSATAEDSASAAWAGQLDSFLNTTEKKLLENVKRCWASLFTPRAIFYRFEKGLHGQKISVAVVIQKMVESEISGIAFSVHPVTQDYNQMIIEAGLGLGEAIVSGQITPDSYVLEKQPRKIIDINVSHQERGLFRINGGGNEWRDISSGEGKKQTLTNQQILKLSDIIIQIEKHYGFPCDIEWAFEKGKFYIVQSRPITTLQTKKPVVEANQYQPIFKFAEYNVLMTDFFFLAYRELGPLVTIVDSKWIFYLSENRQQELAELGYIYASQKGFFENFKKRSLGEGREFRQLAKINLGILSDAKFILFLDKLFAVGERFVKDYRITEYTYFIKIEQELKTFLGEDLQKVLAKKGSLKKYPPHIRRLADYMINMQHLKFELRKVINETLMGEESLINNVFLQLIRRTGRNDILSMTLLEVKKCLSKEKDIPDVSARNEYSYITYENGIKIVSGKEAKEKINLLQSNYTETEVKGVVACRGKAQGRVKIIPLSLDPKKYLGKMERGDILVSDTTGPELLPAIRKAAAIITDEGGLMSHAAIVAREFNIPCIVGTKFVTSILKDNDLVEVDANQGIVKILEIKQGKKENKKLLLVKEHSREYSLFHIAAYSEILKLTNQKFGCQMENELFLSQELVETYHEPAEIKGMFAAIAKKAQDKKFVEKIIRDFNFALKNILPYLNEERYVKNIKELKDLYELFLRFYEGIAYVWVIPGLTSIPASLRKAALAAREATEKYSSKRDQLFIVNLKRLFSKLGDQVKFLLPKEVFKQKVDQKIIKQLKERALGYIYYRDQVFAGQKFKNFFVEHDIQLTATVVSNKNGEVSGTIAYRGSIKGKAKIVFTVKDLVKIESGDVLVSPMTRPEYLPAMKKAAAFVTDEGGITCHAAIVAREMKKPCVIGTKIATQVLQDGDLVEVDANKGIVKILETKQGKEENNKANSLVQKFLALKGHEQLMTFEADFLPLLVVLDWFNYYDSNNKLSEDIYPYFCHKKGAFVRAYVSFTKYNGVPKIVFSQFLKGKFTIKKAMRSYQLLNQAINKSYDSYFAKKFITEDGLLFELKNVYGCLKELVAQTLFLDTLDQRIISETLKQKKLRVDLDKIWAASQILDFLSFEQHNNEEIIATVKNQGDLSKLQYIYTNYTHVPSLDEIKTTIKSIDIKAASTKLAASKKVMLENKKIKIKQARNLNKLERQILEFIDWSGFLRDDRKVAINKGDALIFDITKDLYRRWGIDQALVTLSFIPEVLKGKQYILDHRSQIMARAEEVSVIYFGHDEYEEKIGESPKELKVLDQRLLAQNATADPDKDEDIIKGEGASAGQARGKIKIILKKMEFDNFKTGEILVTGMTRPEFVPLMKKAVAVITDEGGITSHAAIISRELGIPCVIGTKIATKVLHDGDLVEVDGGKGIVRIINK